MSDPNVIDRFRDEYRFLSNFWLATVVHNGVTYPSSEAAYQAQKCPARASEFVNLTPFKAKLLGQEVEVREDWLSVRESVMREVLFDKFSQNPELAEKLIATGDAQIIEGNHWGDTYWGVCDGEGRNVLGTLLMETRERLKEMQDDASAESDDDAMKPVFHNFVKVGFPAHVPNENIAWDDKWSGARFSTLGLFGTNDINVMFNGEFLKTPEMMKYEYVVIPERHLGSLEWFMSCVSSYEALFGYFASMKTEFGLFGSVFAKISENEAIITELNPLINEGDE